MASLTLHPSGTNCLEIYITIDSFKWLYGGRQLCSHGGQVIISPGTGRHVCTDDACIWEGTSHDALVEHAKATHHEINGSPTKIEVVITVPELLRLSAAGHLHLAFACFYLIEGVKFMYTPTGGTWYSASEHQLNDPRSPPVQWSADDALQSEKQKEEMVMDIFWLEYDKYILTPHIQRELKATLERQTASEKIIENLRLEKGRLLEELKTVEIVKSNKCSTEACAGTGQALEEHDHVSADVLKDDQIKRLQARITSLQDARDELIRQKENFESQLVKITAARGTEINDIISLREQLTLMQSQTEAAARECEERKAKHAKYVENWQIEHDRANTAQHEASKLLAEDRTLFIAAKAEHDSNLAKKAAEVEVQNSKIRTLRDKIGRLHREKNMFTCLADNKISELTTQLALLTEANISNTAYTRNLETEVANLKTENKNLLAKVESEELAQNKLIAGNIDDDIDKAIDKIRHASDEHFKKLTIDSDSYVQTYKEIISKLEAENKSLLVKHDELFLKLDARTAQIAECTELLEAERSRFKTDTESLEAKFLKLESQWKVVPGGRKLEKFSDLRSTLDFHAALSKGFLIEEVTKMHFGDEKIQEDDTKTTELKYGLARGLQTITTTGLRVQARIIANAKEGLIDRAKMSYKRDTATHAIIEAGNEAAHRADFLSHFAMSYMGLLTADQHKTYMAMYRLKTNGAVVLSDKIIQIMDEIGTMAAISPRIKFKPGSHSQKLFEEFEEIASELCNMRDALSGKKGTVLAGAMAQFDSYLTKGKKLERLRAISTTLRKLDKERNRD